MLTGKSYFDDRELESTCVSRNEAHGCLTLWASDFSPCRRSILRSSRAEQRGSHRVEFERGFPANLMAIDGTWRRGCTLNDISETGARLTVESSMKGLSLKEFFLLLSSPGLAYRRCQLAWVNGDQIGVTFLKQKPSKRKTALDR